MHEPLIQIARPETGAAEAAAVARVLASGWLAQGPEVLAFEQEFAAYTGAAFACAVSSGTAALHLALLAADIGPGDEVITVSHSFIATASSIRHCGALPVFVDIDPATYNIDPAGIERAISPRTRAIVCVHQMGMPCELAAIVPIAQRHGLLLIEDAACAAGSEYLWQGTWQQVGCPRGDMACFSFHPRKLITTGEGGMVTCTRPEHDRHLRRLRQHGMDVAAHTRHVATEVIHEGYVELGYNFRMSDVHAAIGRVQLTRLPAMVARRRALAARYQQVFAGSALYTVAQEPPWARSNWQSFAVRLAPSVDQRLFMQTLLNHGIATRRGVMNAHREAAYPRGTWACAASAGPAAAPACACAPHTCRQLPHSEAAQDQVVLIPLSSMLSDAEQARVIEVMQAFAATQGQA